MKKIVLFGAGKSAPCLIEYLAFQTLQHHWQVLIADTRTDHSGAEIPAGSRVQFFQTDVLQEDQRTVLISDADIVISLLPASLHFLIAKDCIRYGKNLLTASYVDDKIKMLETDVRSRNLLFLCEIGLDPGIDHMSAMQIIHRIGAEKGIIHSFRSHAGGLVAPESDDNPWHYKISWNPRNIVRAGSAGAVYKEGGTIKTLSYESLFHDCKTVSLANRNSFAYYPNRDSMSYIPVYGLGQASTFLRTTLRHPDFCMGWDCIVAAGLTDDIKPVRTDIKYISEWTAPIQPYVNSKNKMLFDALGFFEPLALPLMAKTNADVLQDILEKKWKMNPDDKDMIVMLHEFEYEIADKKYSLQSSLIVKGENNIRTAMAKTVGLPIGIAASLILQDKISLKGIHIPILPEIYEPVLEALATAGIRFTETIS